MNKRLYISTLAFFACLAGVSAREAVVKSCDVARADGNISVNMTISTPDGASSNQEFVLTPVLRSEVGTDSVVLPSLTMAGRTRYYQELRAGNATGSSLVRASKKFDAPYSASVPFEPWMERSSLSLRVETRGCCGKPEAADATPLAALDYRPRSFQPAFSYVSPSAVQEAKTRTLNGRAYIDFPVNVTAIRPDYRRNPSELAKIDATIDSVKLDKDITINSLTIKGYASPEGSFASNERLAKGRTMSLRDYVQKLHHFAPGLIKTSWEAEDWDGLRKWVEGSEIPERDALLEIIDSDLAPDAKDARIKTRYPATYRMLLADVYPALRHSDYTIDYTIRTFTDPAEIRRIALSAPHKLSINEFYLAAQTMTPGSADYDRLWQAALGVYPDSEVANINAANAAMASGNLERAESCLRKAGDSGEALYALGNLEALKGNLDKARELFRRAARLKVADAPAALDRLEAITSVNPVTILIK